MIKITIIFLSYILIFFNTYLLSNENIGEIKIGLLAPFSGKYKNLGDSLLLSTQLALDEIGDKKIISKKMFFAPIFQTFLPLLLRNRMIP